MAQTVSDEKQKAEKLTAAVTVKEVITAVPTQNREADSLSINSSVLQVNHFFMVLCSGIALTSVLGVMV